MPSGLLRQLLSASAESHTAQLLRVARRLGKPLVTCAAEPVTWQKRDSTIDNQQECLKGLGIALVTVAELAEPTIAIAKLPSCQSCLAPTTCADRCQWRVKDIIAEGATRIGAGNGNISAARKLARFIDHTLLKPEAIEADIRKLCAEAREHCFASVCINPTWVSLAADLLKGSPVQVCTVIGFPLGATDPATKAFEAREAASNGASEIDMVINVGALKSKNYRLVEDDIHQVARAVPRGTIVKVILETSLLSDEEKVAACLLAKRAGADFVKTSTGFGGGGATTSDIILMRTAVGPELGVKASGGVRDAKTATEMLAAGATRIGASASVAIVKGASGKEQY
ncbi:MAG: deoxyribose-phosphate aldolase [Cyanobacteria bacterium NC_groundwater_1444_Ag_S-0.65um_54_12]|nr:deoxyribose-phosphate aldolase [Cyanobacteria bacterium NC_groundwater_1444_Ag_S-0.65um_54_12]